MLVPFDRALKNFVSLLSWRGSPLPVYFSAGSRFFSDSERSPENRNARTLSLPHATIWRTRPNPVQGFMAPVRFPTGYRDVPTGVVGLALKPIEVECSVQIDLFCKTHLEADYLTTQLISLFPAGEVSLAVDWEDPENWEGDFADFDYMRYFGKQVITLGMDSINDTTALEFGDDTENSRVTFSGTLIGLVPRPMTLHPMAKHLILDLDLTLPVDPVQPDDGEEMTVSIEE